ncbi:unnamed protein product [Rotaria sp. Silwood1]|nr:unnamed protein product [Rotaria sp. Silwood1]
MGFMSIFVKICSVHTPSSNPLFKPARSLSFKHGSYNPRHHGLEIPRPPTSPLTLTGIELNPLEQRSKVAGRGKSSSKNKDNISCL